MMKEIDMGSSMQPCPTMSTPHTQQRKDEGIDKTRHLTMGAEVCPLYIGERDRDYLTMLTYGVEPRRFDKRRHPN